MKQLWPCLVVALLASCHEAPVRSSLHYTVGTPYEASGVWHYPKANFAYDETGIAAVMHEPHGSLTTDGELYSPRAFAAQHASLELPAIARITNLENGEQVVVRINDRGPANPGRIIALTPAAARALGFGGGETAKVRVVVLAGPSEQLAMALPGGPSVAVEKAPVATVTVQNLAPPGDTLAPAAASSKAPERGTYAAQIPPSERPGARSRVAPSPGMIYVRAGRFTGASSADLERTALARFGARMIDTRGNGAFRYEVRIGPFAAVEKADAVLKAVLAQGFNGARLEVE